MALTKLQYHDYANFLATYCKEEWYLNPQSLDAAKSIISFIQDREQQIEIEIANIKAKADKARKTKSRCETLKSKVMKAGNTVEEEKQNAIIRAKRMNELGLDITDEKNAIAETEKRMETMIKRFETVQNALDQANEQAHSDTDIDAKRKQVTNIYDAFDRAIEAERNHSKDKIKDLLTKLPRTQEEAKPYIGNPTDKKLPLDTAFFSRTMGVTEAKTVSLLHAYGGTSVTSLGGSFLKRLRKIRGKTAKTIAPEIKQVMAAMGIGYGLRTRQFNQVLYGTAVSLAAGLVSTTAMLANGEATTPSLTLGMATTAFGMTFKPFRHATRNLGDENHVSPLYKITAPILGYFAAESALQQFMPEPYTDLYALSFSLSIAATRYLNNITHPFKRVISQAATIGTIIGVAAYTADPYAHINDYQNAQQPKAIVEQPVQEKTTNNPVERPATPSKPPRIIPLTPG